MKKQIIRGLASGLRRFPRLYRFCRAVFRALSRGIRYRVRKAFQGQAQIFFVKIGANDGLEGDPLGETLLRDARYRGILVEPIPFLARRLEKNFPDRSRFRIEPVAVTDSTGVARMYYVDEQAARLLGRPVEDWYFEIASLRREHLLKHLPRGLESVVRELKVACMTFADLMAKNRVQAVDLLHLDTEGHDFVILRQIDFRRWRPKVVLFEHLHLSEADRGKARQYMEQRGYEVTAFDWDFLCIRAADPR